MGGILNGIISYFGAFGLIGKLRLWNYLFLPVLVSVILGVAIFSTAWGFSDNIGHWMVSWYPFDTGKGWLEGAATFISGMFVIAIGLIIFKQLVMALSAPFMSPMSEAIESHMRGNYEPVKITTAQFTQDLIRGLTIALRNIVRELLITLLLFLLSFIPIFTPITPVLLFLVQAYYAGFGNMDYTLERHLKVRDSVRFVRKNWGLALGNGAVFIGLLFTVVGFLVVIPLGAAAATKPTLKRLNKGGLVNKKYLG